MSDWQLDNKEWVKARKAQWPDYLWNIDLIGGGGAWNKETLVDMKEYFLTGSEQSRNNIQNWLDYLEPPAFIELWLHPSESVPTLKEVLKHHYSAPKFHGENLTYIKQNLIKVLGNCSNPKFKGVSVFNGRETVLYQVLAEPRFLRANYHWLNDERFLEEACRAYCAGASVLAKFLREPQSPQVFAALHVDFWHDALLLGYYPRPEFGWLIKASGQVLAQPGRHSQEQIEVATKVAAILAQENLPDVIKREVDRIRAGGALPRHDLPRRSYIADTYSSDK